MVDLNINLVAKMAGAGAGGAAGGAAGAAGAGLAGRAGGVLAAGVMGGAGSRTEMIGKGLGQISKQLPGAGMLGDMAGAFKSGGVVGVGMAGVAGIMGFVKQIMESSKVFQGIAGSFFKIFGAMADVFLLPFLPLAMKGMQLLMRYLPNFSRWGQSAADGVENIIKTFKDKGFWGAIGHYLTEAWSFISEDVTTWVKDVLMPALANTVMHIGGAVGNAMKAAMSGKEKVGAFGKEGSPTGESEIIQQKTGRWQAHKGAFWSRLGERGGKAIFNAATFGLTGGRAKDWQWSPEAMESQSGNVSEEVLDDIARRLNKGESKEHIMQSWDAGRYGVAPKSKALGGIVEGGPGQGVPTILHGGELVIPRGNVQSLKGINNGVDGVLAATNGQLQELEDDINNYWMEAKQARQDPQSDFMKFKLEVIGEDLPNTLSTVDSWYKGLGNTANTIANQTKGFGAGKYGGVTPWRDTGSGDDRIGGPTDGVEIDPSFEGWDWQKDLDKKTPPTYKEALQETQAILKGTSWETAAPPNSTDLDMGFNVVTWKVADSPAFSRTYEKALKETQNILKGTSWEAPAPSNSLDLDMGMEAWQSSMEILESQIQEAAKTGGAGFYGLDDQEDAVYAEQVRKAYAERIEKRKLELQQEQFRRDNEENERMKDSLQKANEAIYGPEGGIGPEGKFAHGGLLAERTDLSNVGRLKTLDEMGLTEQQRADLGADYKINAQATAAPRVDAETKALENMIYTQIEKINDYEPLIKAAWRWADAGGEGGPNQDRRGTEAQRLIKERSQQEERLTRMWNQHAQDRLPYSLQEFQTRFSEGMAAGGIVPGDIGEPQMVVAHGGETVSPIGMPGGRQGHTSNRVMNISINNVSSVRDILRDLNDMESMDDASFFNSVT